MVFPQDTAWQAEYAKTMGNAKLAQRNVRYRSWGTEELLVKCVMKYMPWLRTIHLLLASETQVQPWMERLKIEDGRLKIVFHREFIPEQYLPTFNVNTIEMWLHRIPDLSEHFIYSNDDFFPLSPLKESDFFRDGLPCQHMKEQPYPSKPNIFHKFVKNGLDMVAEDWGAKFGKTWLRTGHSMQPMLRSSVEQVCEKHADRILQSFTTRRDPKNFNQYIFPFWQHLSGQYIDYVPRSQYVGPKTATGDIASILRDPDCGIVCLNDNEKMQDWEKRAEIVRKEISAKLEQSEQNRGNVITTSRNNATELNKNTKIFICTHTDFECPVSNPVYEIADTRKLFNSVNSDGVDELFYSELRTYHHLAENVELPQYVGFCQYRKYYEFLDDVPDLEAIISEHGCITAEPLRLKQNVYDQYDRCFYFGDMDITKAILYETAPDLYPTFQKMLNGDMLYVGNMFIMPRENFLEAMQIVWTCLQHYLTIVGKDIKGRIKQHAPLYLRRGGKYGTVEHQYRFGGSLGERIMSAYIMHHFTDPKTYKIHLTENEARPYRKLQKNY